jgi:hypothetical protein
VESRQLDGEFLLLLLIERASPHRVHLLTGRARWDGTALVVGSGSRSDVQVHSTELERDGFTPAVLPKLVGDEKYVPMAEQYASKVRWCVPMLVDEVPESAEAVPGFLGGLATGRNGELYLMQVR